LVFSYKRIDFIGNRSGSNGLVVDDGIVVTGEYFAGRRHDDTEAAIKDLTKFSSL
jgi:hypothetical protein